MQVTVEDISAVKKKITIEIPKETVSREVNTAYQKIKNTARIKGYRPGKTPRSVLERLFSKDVHAEVAGTLIQTSLIEAVKEKDLPFLGTPQIDTSELDPAGPFTYNATVEIKPELADVEFAGIKLTRKNYHTSEGEIEHQINLLRNQLAQLKPIGETRPAAEGDYVIIDYEGFKDGQPFAETEKTIDYNLKIGQGMITEDFDKALVGMNPGETKEFDIDFPVTYHNARLAGQRIGFQVHLKEIREQILPELDAEFASSLGDYASVDEVKNEIRANLQAGYDKRSEQELHEQIFEKLIPEPFEVPDVLVQYELDDIIHDTEMRFARNNMKLEDVGLTRDKLETEYREVAKKQVRRHLLLSKIMEQENLQIGDEVLDAEYGKLAETLKQPVDVIKQYYQASPEKLDGFKHALLEKKAIDLIIGKAEVEYVEAEAMEPSTDAVTGE
jgi:trigger factor